MRRVALNFLDAEVAVGERRDLREVRDRHDLRPLGESPQRLADGVRGLAADPGVDLVEDHRLAAADRGNRQRDAGELAARGGLGDRRKREARVRPDQERDLVGAARGRLPLAELDAELALAQSDPLQLLGDRGGKRVGGLTAGVAQLPAERRDLPLGVGERLGSGRGGIGLPFERLELGPRLGCALEQLLVAIAAETPPCLDDAVELRLDLLEPVGLGLERRQEGAQLGSGLAQSQLDVTQLVAGPLELRGEALQRRERALGQRDQAGGALAVVRRQRLARGGRALGELGHVTQAFALAAQAVLGAALEALGVLDERAQLGEASLRGGRVPGQLVVPLAGGTKLAPGDPQRGPAPELPLAGEPVEQIELVRRTGEAALLELPRHRDEPLGRRRDVFARGAPAPRVRTCATVREDAPGEYEAVLALRSQFRECARLLVEEALGRLELGLDVRFVAVRPDEAGVPARAEQQADRLREDRLAGAGLAGDRVQARRERELRLADQDEVLDAEPAKHAWMLRPPAASGDPPKSPRHDGFVFTRPWVGGG